MPATPIYRAIMLQLEERRQAYGLSMWQVDDGAGTPDGYYAKALHADAPSGRQAQWETLQLIIDFLFAGGFSLTLVAAPTQPPEGAPTFKRKLKHISATFNPKTRRELMAEIGRRGREIQLKLMTPEQRARVARKGWRTRKRRRSQTSKA